MGMQISLKIHSKNLSVKSSKNSLSHSETNIRIIINTITMEFQYLYNVKEVADTLERNSHSDNAEGSINFIFFSWESFPHDSRKLSK